MQAADDGRLQCGGGSKRNGMKKVGVVRSDDNDVDDGAYGPGTSNEHLWCGVDNAVEL